MKKVALLFCLCLPMAFLSMAQSNEVGAGIGLAFNGDAGNYVDLGDVYNDLTFPLMIEAWIKPEDYAAAAIFSTDNDGTAEYGLQVQLSGSGQLQVEFGNGMGAGSSFKRGYITNVVIPLNAWTHFAISCKTADDITIYINGVSKSFIATGGSSTATEIAHSNASAAFGKLVTPQGTVAFHGEMDEIRLWNKSRSQFQIRNNTCVKYADIPSKMIGYWTADESYTSNVLVDKAGTPENGMLTGIVGRVLSGAALGNEAKYKFTNNWFEVKVTLYAASGDKMLTQDVSGDGIFVYVIEGPPLLDEGLNTHPDYYYGVYNVKSENGTGGYNVRYKYSGNNGVTDPGNEYLVRLMARSDDTDAPWIDLNGSNDTATNWITQHDGVSQRGEYTFDVPSGAKQLEQALSDNAAPIVSLYPNPASDQLQIAIQSAQEVTSIKVLNETGAVVRIIDHDIQEQLTLDTGSLPDGSYFVELNTKSSKSFGRFMVQH